MGADIYYDGPHYKEEQRLWEALQAEKHEVKKEELHLKWKKLYDNNEDYFRDSYNNSSVFWQMGLSWWPDVSKVLDEAGRLPIDEAIKLRKYIENHPIVREEITWEDWETKKPVVFTVSVSAAARWNRHGRLPDHARARIRSRGAGRARLAINKVRVC